MGTRPRSAPDVGWMLDVVAREHPARVALVDAETGDRRTYGQLRDRTHQAANALWGLGVRPGQTFGLLAHNCVEYLEVVFAAARIGATVVLVNRRLTVREMVHELHASDVTGLLYSWKYAKAAAEISALTAEKLWWCQTGADVSASEGREVHSYGALLAQSVTTFDHPSEADLADAGLVIIYTSGTTGKPKGAVLTQRNVLAAAGSNQMFYSWYAQRLQPRLRQLVMVGLNHIAGLFAVTMPTLASGGEVVLLDDFDPVKTLRTIDAHRPNFIFGIGSLWDEILAQDSTMYDLSSVELVITCVTYQKSENLRRLRDTFGAELFMTFGQTETTTFTIATRATDDLLERPRTVGKPFGYVEIRLVRQDGTPARAGEEGELHYRGPSVFKGYYGESEATAEAFAEDGWFRSGDLMRLDEDGYLYFVDRTKDVIKSGGLNVYAFEVEQVIEQLPTVAATAVVGLPDEKWGEAVTAFVVPTPGSDLTAEAVVDWCRERLAHYKVPKAVHFIDAIPVNTLGKKMKRVLVQEHGAPASQG